MDLYVTNIAITLNYLFCFLQEGIMKKSFIFLSCLMIALLIQAAIPCRAFADTPYTWFGFTYKYINNGSEIEITSYIGTDPDITVPIQIYDVPVTAVNLLAILHPEVLRSVGIPAGVKDIRSGSLQNCPNLNTLNFWGNAPKVWGSNNGQPFCNNAPDLKIYYMPGKTGFTNPWYGHPTEVAPAPLVDHAYYKSQGYTYQIRPDNSAVIIEYDHYYGEARPEVVIPAQLEGHPVVKIGPGAFKDNNHITSVRIPDGVISIGEYAFKYCGLNDITIPNSVTRIDNGAFYSSCLTRVSLPVRLEQIGELAFGQCNDLHMAKFFGNAPSLGSRVFEHCAADFIIYYAPGVTGFSDPWHGYDTELLPTVPTSGSQQKTFAINLQAQASPVSIVLNWNSINDPKGVSGYNVYKGLSAQELANQTQPAAYVAGTTYTDRLVQSGKTYYYIVKPVYRDKSIGKESNLVSATPRRPSGTIQLTVDQPHMTVDGIEKETDAGYGTAPVIKDGRMFLPIGSVVGEMGGSIKWDGSEQKITIEYNGKTVELWIGQTKANVDGIATTMNTGPFISDTGRTMLPLSFVAQNLGCEISWDSVLQTATITGYGIGDTPKVQKEGNTPAPLPERPTGIPGSIPAPSIANLQLLKDESGLPYFRLEVTIPESVRTLDKVRPADGWIDMETYTKVDNDEWIPDGGGLEVFTQEPVPGKSGVYYITFNPFDEGDLSETVILSKKYTFKTRFYYTYVTGDEHKYVYSPWSNEVSGQSESYYRSEEE